MQLKFKNASEYIRWRTHWRRELREVSMALHTLKKCARGPTNNLSRHKSYLRQISNLKITARTMMMAREAVEEAYRARRELIGASHLNDGELIFEKVA